MKIRLFKPETVHKVYKVIKFIKFWKRGSDSYTVGNLDFA